MLNLAKTFAGGAARQGVLVRSARRGAAAVAASSSRAGSALAPFPSRVSVSSFRAPIQGAAGTCSVPFAPFSSKIVDVRRSSQRETWDEYLSGKTTAADVFSEIDLNYNGTISVQEINYFLESVEGRGGVDEKAFEMLQALGEDHELDATEFGGWINMATNASAEEASEAAAAEPAEPAAEEAAPAAEPKKKIVDARKSFQKLVWDEYLTTGKHGPDLFIMIDLNKNGTISVEEIIYFLDSVERKGVRESEFDRLVALGNDHELDESEFLEWLTDAAEIEEHGEARFGASGCTPGQW